MTTPRNKRPDLKIDAAQPEDVPPPIIVAHTSPFVDLSGESASLPNNKAEGYTSNTSSSSSDDDDAPRVERRVSFRNKNQVVLTGKIDLSGVDSTPFTPNSRAKAEAVSPFLDEADFAKAALTKSTVKRTIPLKIDLSKKRVEQQPPTTTTPADEFAVERRELQARARRAERRLAFALMENALRRRKNQLLRLFLRRWRLAASMHITPFSPQRQEQARGVMDDAQVLADQLLKRLRELRGE